MGKIKRDIRKLHSREIKGRKLLKSHRKGNFYLQVDTESKSGTKYINTIEVHKYGTVLREGLINSNWEYLIACAKDRI